MDTYYRAARKKVELLTVKCNEGSIVPSFDDSADRVVRDIPGFLTKSGASVPVSGNLRSEAVKEVFFSEPADAEGLVGLVKGMVATALLCDPLNVS